MLIDQGALLVFVHVRVVSGGLTLTPLFGPARRFVPVTSTLFRLANEPLPTLALESDSLNGRPFAFERMGYLLPLSYHRIAASRVWIQLGLVAAFVLMSLVTVLFALVWVPRRLFGRLRGAADVSVRGWPLLAALTLVLAIVLGSASPEDNMTRFGGPTVWSVGLCLATLLFGVAAGGGWVAAWRARGAGVHRGVLAYAGLANAVNLIAAAYLAHWGLIGWRSWEAGARAVDAYVVAAQEGVAGLGG